MRCPICKNNSATSPLCESCGFDFSANVTFFPTLCLISKEASERRARLRISWLLQGAYSFRKEQIVDCSLSFSREKEQEKSRVDFGKAGEYAFSGNNISDRITTVTPNKSTKASKSTNNECSEAFSNQNTNKKSEYVLSGTSIIDKQFNIFNSSSPKTDADM